MGTGSIRDLLHRKRERNVEEGAASDLPKADIQEVLCMIRYDDGEYESDVPVDRIYATRILELPQAYEHIVANYKGSGRYFRGMVTRIEDGKIGRAHV